MVSRPSTSHDLSSLFNIFFDNNIICRTRRPAAFGVGGPCWSGPPIGSEYCFPTYSTSTTTSSTAISSAAAAHYYLWCFQQNWNFVGIGSVVGSCWCCCFGIVVAYCSEQWLRCHSPDSTARLFASFKVHCCLKMAKKFSSTACCCSFFYSSYSSRDSNNLFHKSSPVIHFQSSVPDRLRSPDLRTNYLWNCCSFLSWTLPRFPRSWPAWGVVCRLVVWHCFSNYSN